MVAVAYFILSGCFWGKHKCCICICLNCNIWNVKKNSKATKVLLTQKWAFMLKSIKMPKTIESAKIWMSASLWVYSLHTAALLHILQRINPKQLLRMVINQQNTNSSDNNSTEITVQRSKEQSLVFCLWTGSGTKAVLARQGDFEKEEGEKMKREKGVVSYSWWPCDLHFLSMPHMSGSVQIWTKQLRMHNKSTNPLSASWMRRLGIGFSQFFFQHRYSGFTIKVVG